MYPAYQSFNQINKCFLLKKDINRDKLWRLIQKDTFSWCKKGMLKFPEEIFRFHSCRLILFHLLQIFTVHHKAVNENGGWESKTVFEQSVVVLEGFRAHTNYTVKVRWLIAGI